MVVCSSWQCCSLHLRALTCQALSTPERGRYKASCNVPTDPSISMVASSSPIRRWPGVWVQLPKLGLLDCSCRIFRVERTVDGWGCPCNLRVCAMLQSRKVESICVSIWACSFVASSLVFCLSLQLIYLLERCFIKNQQLMPCFLLLRPGDYPRFTQSPEDGMLSQLSRVISCNMCSCVHAYIDKKAY